ncbi:nucleotide-binding alpha-beta plait domain-containing protein [Tanacetum coccineum]
MLIISTISEASFRHVQGTTSRDLWLSLKKAYAPHSTSRQYTLKTQLLRIEMHGDKTPDAYQNRAQEYADALAAIGEPVKDKYLVMLDVSGLHKEYNGLKTTITVWTAFSELHALLSDHDYILGKTRAPALIPYKTSNVKMAILTSGTSTCGSMEQVASSFSARHCVYLKSLSSQRQHQRPRCFRYSYDKLSKLGTSEGSPRMILNGYVGRDTYRMKKDNDEKIYRRLDSCYVIPPPKGKKPKAIIKFLGGAFIGAVPEVTYGSVVLPVFILFPLFYLLGLLANEGYLIISVPYNVTFDHSQAAREVFERFHSCLNSVLTYGLPSDGLLAAELVDLPLYSVGHRCALA